jgi:hypothetical protein
MSWAQRICLLILTFGVVGVWGQGVPQWNEAFLGIDYVDALGTQWFYWFVDFTIGSGNSPGHTDLFFYPWGKDIFAHTGTNILDAVFCIPFRRVFGPVLGYNLFVFGGLVVSAFAFFILCKDHIEDKFALGVATLGFFLAPFPLFEVLQGRPTQAILLFPVLFVRHLIRSSRKSGWVDPVIAGLSLAISGYQYWYYALFGGLVALAWGLGASLRAGGRQGLAILVRFALIAAIALVVTAPVALPLLRGASGEEVPGLFDLSRWTLHSNPPMTVEDMTVGVFMWQPFRRFAGFFVVDPAAAERLLDQTVLLPLSLFFAAVVALWRKGPLPRLPLAAALAMCVVIGAGPLVVLGPVALPNVVYLNLVEELGVVRRLWWPARMVAFATILSPLCLGVLVQATARRSTLLSVFLVGALAIPWHRDLMECHLFPLPVWEATIPKGYECLKSGPEGAIIELPFNWTQAHLYYQSAHGRPMLGGMLEDNPVFTPQELTDLREDNAFLARLIAVGRMEKVPEELNPQGKEQLIELGYRWVVFQNDAVHVGERKEGLSDNTMRTRARRIYRELDRSLGSSVYRDARITIWSLTGQTESPCAGQELDRDLKTIGFVQHPGGDIRPAAPELTLLRRVVDGPVTALGEARTRRQEEMVAEIAAQLQTRRKETDTGIGWGMGERSE